MLKLEGKKSLDLIEEATRLLRVLPPGVLLAYYLGACPFILGLLFFLSNMAYDPDAVSQHAMGSFIVALLFMWMKCWQAVFTDAAARFLREEPAEPWTAGRIKALIMGQVTYQGLGLFLIPISLLCTLPFAWVYTFFQNICVLGGRLSGRELFQNAREQAMLWPKQNHVLFLILFLFAMFIAFNLVAGAVMVPFLMKTLLGWDSPFTRSMAYLTNTSFIAVILGGTYLCVDPLFKAVYILRCHYGLALSTGVDLRVSLKDAVRAAGKLLIAGLLIGAALQGTPLHAYQVEQTTIESSELSEAIDHVISGPQYSWRMKRDAPEKSKLGTFLKDAWDFMVGILESVGTIIEKAIRWVFDIFPGGDGDKRSGDLASGVGGSWFLSKSVIGLLALVFLAVFALLIWRLSRRRKTPQTETQSAAVPIRPDLTDEAVIASDLPEDEWLAMAREMMAKGEARLALRALYLSTLAYLDQHGLILVGRHKTNREYYREAGGRAHAFKGLLGGFGNCIEIFEYCWYGSKPADENTVAAYARLSSEMRSTLEKS